MYVETLDFSLKFIEMAKQQESLKVKNVFFMVDRTLD